MSKAMLSVGVVTHQVTHKSVDLEIQAPGLPVKALCPRRWWPWVLMGRGCVGLGEGNGGVSLEQWFSTQGFQPRGCLLMFNDNFVCHNSGWGSYRSLEGRGKDAAKHPIGHRTIPITKCDPAA